MESWEAPPWLPPWANSGGSAAGRLWPANNGRLWPVKCQPPGSVGPMVAAARGRSCNKESQPPVGILPLALWGCAFQSAQLLAGCQIAKQTRTCNLAGQVEGGRGKAIAQYDEAQWLCVLTNMALAVSPPLPLKKLQKRIFAFATSFSPVPEWCVSLRDFCLNSH